MANEMPAGANELRSLKESDLEIQNKHDDVRGRKVYDRADNHIGKVDDLLVDESEGKVRFLRVAQGGFLGMGEKHYLVPVDAVVGVDDDAVRLGAEHERVSGAPDYDPALASENSRDYWGGVYGYWGYDPYWSPGYAYPGYPNYGTTPRRPGEPEGPPLRR